MSELIVSKFGGTSNADAASIAQCVELAQDSAITVVSAPGKLDKYQMSDYSGSYAGDPTRFASKVTDQLILDDPEKPTSAFTEYRDNNEVSADTTESIKARFDLVVDELDIESLRRSRWTRKIPGRIDEAVRQGVDATSNLGERMQAEIWEALGFDLIDPTEFVIPDGADDPDVWLEEILKIYKPGHRYVMPGNTYYDGKMLRTFDRGGSDITGALAAYSIGAVYHNMTDTSALSANPAIFKGMEHRLRPIPHLTYREGRELGRNGTGLLHPAAIIPLMGTGIKTIVRNTFDPNGENTHYSDEVDSEERRGRVMAISLMEAVDVIEVHEPGMSDKTGRIADFTSRLRDKNVNIVDTVAGGADTELIIVNGDEVAAIAEPVLKEGLLRGGSVVSNQFALVSLVGYGLRDRSRQIQNILGDSNVFGKGNDAPYVLTGTDSVRFAVNRANAEQVVRDVHRLLVES